MKREERERQRRRNRPRGAAHAISPAWA
jgi:hypothetical protein